LSWGISIHSKSDQSRERRQAHFLVSYANTHPSERRVHFLPPRAPPSDANSKHKYLERKLDGSGALQRRDLFNYPPFVIMKLMSHGRGARRKVRGQKASDLSRGPFAPPLQNTHAQTQLSNRRRSHPVMNSTFHNGLYICVCLIRA
jgi:hypothetical protein